MSGAPYNKKTNTLSSSLLAWLGGVLGVGAAIIVVVLTQGAGGFGDSNEVAPVHVEEFRVAEPLTHPTDTSLRAQLETITAVTEPFDEVEAAVEEKPEELADSQSELEKQCVSVLKEMAFCSNEDAFLDRIGTASNLRTSEERERFMERVHIWFEPGGTRRDCEALFDEDESVANESAKPMWQRSSLASELVCDDFGRVLLDAQAFEWLGWFWES